MQDFRKFKVWHEAQDMTLKIYKLTKIDPMYEEEKFGLVKQIRRASCSICLNIAEGACSVSQPKFAQYLYTSLGSCKEVECCLTLSKNLGYIKDSDYKLIVDHSQKIGSMLNNLIKKVKRKTKNE